MMEELHEFLGMAAMTAAMVAVAAGVIIYRFGWFKELLPGKRPFFLRLHQRGAVIFALLILLHGLTTDKRNFLLMAGAALLFGVLAVGLSFRISKKKMRMLVNTKIALLICALIFLPIGHALVEHGAEDELSKAGVSHLVSACVNFKRMTDNSFNSILKLPE